MGMFNKGDRVRRIRGNHNGMRADDEANVVSHESVGQLFLDKYGSESDGGHDGNNFELVKRAPKAPEINNTYQIF